MHQILVVFENGSGKCVQIAKHVADLADARGDACSLHSLESAAPVDLRTYDAIVVIAPVRRVRQRASVARFVRSRAARLSAMPGAFVSLGPAVPGRQAGGVPSVVRDLLGRAGWSPTVITPIAAGGWQRRAARSARWIFQTVARLTARRAPQLEVDERPDWRSIDHAFDRILDVADEAFVTPAARSHQVASREVRPT